MVDKLYVVVDWRKEGAPTKEMIIDAAAAGWAARSRIPYAELSKTATYDESISFLRRLIGWGHTSVLEPIVFKLMISVSRFISHCIVRHRIASYTQSTYRVKRDFTDEMFVVPPEVVERGYLAIWLEHMFESAKHYHFWIDEGFSVDVARYQLPQGVRTNIAMTINARSLRNFFAQRLDYHAHFEMRDTALKIQQLVFEAGLGFLFEDIFESVSMSRISGVGGEN